MTSLKSNGVKLGRWSIIVGIVLVGALVPTLLGLADSDGGKGRTFEFEFTKWVTTPPNMIGVVDGDVGAGAFAGEIVSMQDVDNFTNIVAVYHINGSKHSFTADIEAVQNNTLGTGEITGVIREGWLEGRSLAGKYSVVKDCNGMETPGNAYGTLCFQGTIEIRPAP